MTSAVHNISLKILPVLRKYGIRSASVVGSFARNHQTRSSDIDIVVDITVPISLLTFSRIKLELEAALEKKVDLIERSAIKPRLRKHLLKDEVIIGG